MINFEKFEDIVFKIDDIMPEASIITNGLYYRQVSKKHLKNRKVSTSFLFHTKTAPTLVRICDFGQCSALLNFYACRQSPIFPPLSFIVRSLF